MTVLVVGVGNPLRSDDGVGPYVANEVSRLNRPQFEVRSAHQLNIELAEELKNYEAILVVDASESGDPICFQKLDVTPMGTRPSSHHLDPETLAALAKKIFKSDPNLYLLTIRGENFELGETLSPNVADRAASAVRIIEAFLRKE